MAADPREPYGRIFHEAGRLTVNAEREKPFRVLPWEQRTDEEKELDMRGAAAVAVQAVADAKARNERLEAQVFALGAHLPAILRALRMTASDDLHAERMADVGRDRAALTALGGGEGQERTDEKGAAT
jgi:hypothetical protein